MVKWHFKKLQMYWFPILLKNSLMSINRAKFLLRKYLFNRQKEQRSIGGTSHCKRTLRLTQISYWNFLCEFVHFFSSFLIINKPLFCCSHIGKLMFYEGSLCIFIYLLLNSFHIGLYKMFYIESHILAKAKEYYVC